MIKFKLISFEMEIFIFLKNVYYSSSVPQTKDTQVCLDFCEKSRATLKMEIVCRYFQLYYL